MGGRDVGGLGGGWWVNGGGREEVETGSLSSCMRGLPSQEAQEVARWCSSFSRGGISPPAGLLLYLVPSAFQWFGSGSVCLPGRAHNTLGVLCSSSDTCL